MRTGSIEVTDEDGAMFPRLGPRNAFGERDLMRDGLATTKAGCLTWTRDGPLRRASRPDRPQDKRRGADRRLETHLRAVQALGTVSTRARIKALREAGVISAPGGHGFLDDYDLIA